LENEAMIFFRASKTVVPGVKVGDFERVHGDKKRSFVGTLLLLILGWTFIVSFVAHVVLGL
jgi:hypothetical protein